MRKMKRAMTKVEAVARELCRQAGYRPAELVEFHRKRWTHYVPEAIKVLKAIKSAERK